MGQFSFQIYPEKDLSKIKWETILEEFSRKYKISNLDGDEKKVKIDGKNIFLRDEEILPAKIFQRFNSVRLKFDWSYVGCIQYELQYYKMSPIVAETSYPHTSFDDKILKEYHENQEDNSIVIRLNTIKSIHQYFRLIGVMVSVIAEAVNGIIGTDIGCGYAQGRLGSNIKYGYYNSEEFLRLAKSEPKELPSAIIGIIYILFKSESERVIVERTLMQVNNKLWRISVDELIVSLLRLSKGDVNRLIGYLPVRSPEKIVDMAKNTEPMKFDIFDGPEDPDLLDYFEDIQEYLIGKEIQIS